MLSATSQPPRASPQALRPEYHFGPVPPLRAPVLAGTCRHLEQEHRCDAHHPHLVPCQEPSQLAPTAHSLASASAQASDGAQPGFPEQSQRHQREQQRCLQVPLQFRNFASVLRGRSSDQGSSHMPPFSYCHTLGSPGRDVVFCARPPRPLQSHAKQTRWNRAEDEGRGAGR